MSPLDTLAPDFADLLNCLEAAGAAYMLVGGYAVMAHGHVRATSDIGLWVRGSKSPLPALRRRRGGAGPGWRR